MTRRRFWQVFMMLCGFIIWAVQFTLIYGATSTTCALEVAETRLLGIGIVPAVIAAVTLAAFLCTAGVLTYALREHRRLQSGNAGVTDIFLSQAAILISAFSIAAIVWQGLPALILPACA
ncbi:hypothetical protein DES45_102521 [Microvirga subterranea]|uniref:Uncharacterized protein n=2 Tax=Microvirga subterranea TaxID=186651 RepID=A0A370HRF3_9HYPH|nr:hypothetical protein DES45_102521 [Microvirga subterranea]